jgi:hypothetical protein
VNNNTAAAAAREERKDIKGIWTIEIRGGDPAEKGQPPNPFENIFERARQEVFDASCWLDVI